VPAQRRIERRVVVAAPPERAWQALTQQALLATWLGQVEHLDLRPAGAGVVRDAAGRRRRLVVEHVEPGVGLSFCWWDADDLAPEPSRVELRLEAQEGGTAVVVTDTAVADDERPPPVAPTGGARVGTAP
jgi:uncharacterized protein YndB with AHSA1/START domain